MTETAAGAASTGTCRVGKASWNQAIGTGADSTSTEAQLAPALPRYTPRCLGALNVTPRQSAEVRFVG